ncbi:MULTISPECIES: DUF4365 domain-containing protein [Nocardia]|uniref:DUF4365 domain-containing protein n=1 Tax=Nocardia sp. TaxID=1821 RepID=UPI0013007C66|nr:MULTISPECIES: DUF4365 domain-containing protein [Nocardia]
MPSACAGDSSRGICDRGRRGESQARAGGSTDSRRRVTDQRETGTVQSRIHSPRGSGGLKCTTQHRRLGAEHLTWSLERERFIKLVNPKRFIPALLAVLLIPENADELLDLSEAGLTSASRMYWEYAANLGGIDDDKASKTVHLPRRNLFDVEGLQAIMRTIGEGEQW